jgi:hypothetical protein
MPSLEIATPTAEATEVSEDAEGWSGRASGLKEHALRLHGRASRAFVDRVSTKAKIIETIWIIASACLICYFFFVLEALNDSSSRVGFSVLWEAVVNVATAILSMLILLKKIRLFDDDAMSYGVLLGALFVCTCWILVEAVQFRGNNQGDYKMAADFGTIIFVCYFVVLILLFIWQTPILQGDIHSPPRGARGGSAGDFETDVDEKRNQATPDGSGL